MVSAWGLLANCLSSIAPSSPFFMFGKLWNVANEMNCIFLPQWYDAVNYLSDSNLCILLHSSLLGSGGYYCSLGWTAYCEKAYHPIWESITYHLYSSLYNICQCNLSRWASQFSLVWFSLGPLCDTCKNLHGAKIVCIWILKPFFLSFGRWSWHFKYDTQDSESWIYGIWESMQVRIIARFGRLICRVYMMIHSKFRIKSQEPW